MIFDRKANIKLFLRNNCFIRYQASLLWFKNMCQCTTESVKVAVHINKCVNLNC